MILEILQTGGLGRSRPLVIDAAQVVIRQDNGTPIVVVAHYGPDRAYAVGSVGHNQPEFQRMLQSLNINETVVVQRLQSQPPPRGAKLLVGPS